MDPRVPESSSPVVILTQTSTQFALPINMADMATTSTINNHPRTRSTIRSLHSEPFDVDSPINHSLQYRQSATLRSTAARALSVSSEGSNVAPTFARDNNNNNNDVAGPTTRSRKRHYHNTNTNTNTVPLAASAPPIRRQTTSSSSSSKRSRTKKVGGRGTNAMKKPPPGLKKKPPPGLKLGDDDVTDKKPDATVDNCCICMCYVEPNDLALINSCDHRFCFGCIEKWSERENKCPLCKVRFTKIDRVNKKRKKGTKNTKKVNDRDQRSDLVPGAALEGLLANLNRNTGSLARIILGGFDFGVGATMSSSRPGGSASRASFAPRSGTRSVINFDDSDEEESPMSQFMRAIHGGGASDLRMPPTVVRPVSVTARFTTTSRSYARNVNDSTAGNGAENPLEIDDDSVEEVIEID